MIGTRTLALSLILLAALGPASAWADPAQTVGGGSIEQPAAGPPPAFGAGQTKFVLVKNWDFGANGTIKDIDDMNTEFQYHDQFGTIGNGTNYGAINVAPDAQNAIHNQPVQDPSHPVREFFADSLKTYLVPLNGALTVTPTLHNIGCGSFQSRFTLPSGGSRLKQDILWETRVRYVTPPYFWFAIWTAGNKWDKGAEMDVIESFGYDNGGGSVNFYGQYWHSDPVGAKPSVDYMPNWGKAMASCGVKAFKAEGYHTWTWLYRKDDTFSAYVDGKEVQSGTLIWTLHSKQDGEKIDMNFIFDATWGHTQIPSVNRSLPAADLQGKFYEWDYSRVYLSAPETAALAPTTSTPLLAMHSAVQSDHRRE